jgi:uncharacterized protein with von Willebrand factor type A (vWA) domain
VWKDNRRRHSETIPTWDLLHTYGPDYRVVFVGDASMSPYEILMPGGSVEHWNPESGRVWLARVLEQWHAAIWLNPVPESAWTYTQSIQILREIFMDRMFPLTLQGIDAGVKALSH